MPPSSLELPPDWEPEGGPGPGRWTVRSYVYEHVTRHHGICGECDWRAALANGRAEDMHTLARIHWRGNHQEWPDQGKQVENRA